MKNRKTNTNQSIDDSQSSEQPDSISIQSMLENDELVQTHQELLQNVISIFDYCQYLLDDDENLTKTANLNSKAKEKLNERILELFLEQEISDENIEELQKA